MNNKKNLTTDENFALALQNHKKKNLQSANKLYNEILKSSPYYQGIYNNLGILYYQLGEFHYKVSLLPEDCFFYDFVKLEQNFHQLLIFFCCSFLI